MRPVRTSHAHLSRAAWITGLVLALVGGPVPAAAEWLEIEVGSGEAVRMPASFDDVLRRVASTGRALAWSQPATFDPYMHSNGATYGTAALERGGGMVVTLTWYAFNSPSDAAQFERDQLQYQAPGPSFAIARHGVNVMVAYDYNAPPQLAEVVLAEVLRP